MKKEFSPNFARVFFKLYCILFSSDEKPVWSSATQAEKWNAYGRFFNCESTQDALGIDTLFIPVSYVFNKREHLSEQ